MIHPGMVHVAHAHVLHGQERARAQRRNRRAHALARRKGRAAQARPVARLADEAVGAVLRCDDDIVGFGGADLELVHRHGPDIETVGLHDRHRQARDADVEGRLRRGVDDPQPHTLVRREQPGPVVVGAEAVDGEGVGRAGNVGDVGGVHPHLRPFPALLRGQVATCEQSRQRHALAVEIGPAHLLELAIDGRPGERAVVGQHQHVLAVVGDRIGSGGIDHDRTVDAVLLLVGAVTVIPVGSGMAEIELVVEGRARHDAREAHAGNAVHLERDEQAVPVDRAVLVERVMDAQAYPLTFLEADQRAGHGAVDADRTADLAVDLHADLADGEGNVVAADGGQRAHQAFRERLSPGGQGLRETEACAGYGGGAQQRTPSEDEFIHRRFLGSLA